MTVKVPLLEVFCVLLWEMNRINDVLHNQNSRGAATLFDWVQSYPIFSNFRIV